MSKPRVILSDCDGVLCDWNGGFTSYMESIGLPQVAGTDHEYSIAARFNISIPAAFKYITDYNATDLISNLNPFADSVKYVAALAEHGFTFIVVTALSDTPEAKTHRVTNLTNLFGNVFSDVHCVGQGADKGFVLRQWADSGYFWIEDHMRQAEAGHEVGLKTVLINHPYNTHYQTDLFPRVSHVSPWEEIYNLVCSEYNITP